MYAPFWSMGKSTTIRILRKRIAKLSSVRVPVLISGAPGSGRSSAARALHEQSPRSSGPCTVLYCAVNPDILGEDAASEPEPGQRSYPSAGWVNAISGGTLVLEDIDRLSDQGQARIQFLCETYLQCVPRDDKKPKSVRSFGLICTTTADLSRRCAEGRFSSGLYYRINGITLALPTVKEWISDLPEIAQHLLSDIATYHRRDTPEIQEDAWQKLCDHEWPGNLLELSAVLERAVVLVKPGTAISSQDLVIEPVATTRTTLSIARQAERDLDTNDPGSAEYKNTPGSLEEGVSLEDYFQNFVLTNQHSMSETELARKLGISRKCLWERRQRFGIPRKGGASDQEQ